MPPSENPTESQPRITPRTALSPLSAAQFLLLLALAVALFLPLLGVAVPLWVVAALLLVRLGLRVWQGVQDRRLFRPAAWVLDAALLGLLLWQGRQP